MISSLFLFACGGAGDWVLSTWGEDYIEQEIPAETFADGCSVTFDRFLVTFTERALIDAEGEVAGELPGAEVWDVHAPGPHSMGTVEVPSGHYDTVRVRIAPDASAVGGNVEQADLALLGGDSVYAAGTLTCPSGEVGFAWSFDTDTTYACEPEDLTIPAGGQDTSELTVHGDHLFYDGLEAEDAAVRGEAIVAADADQDGQVTQAELSAVGVAGLGYSVGQYSEVTELGAFVTFLTQTLGHIDGEGHCQVDL